MTTASRTLKRDARSPGASSLHKLLGRLARRAEGWHAVFQVLVPVGYEDDDGFHFGAEPAAGSQSQEETA